MGSPSKTLQKPKNTEKPNKKEKTITAVPSSSTEEKMAKKKEKVVERESKRSEKRGKGEDEEGEGMCRFAFSRVERIAKCEDSDMEITTDALFLINKATEKFLETLTEGAYASSVKDQNDSISYKNLSNVVHNETRYKFLSDFVPEMLKAEDALADWKKTMEARGN